MIPVKPQPEPANFNSRVRIPGQNFLTKYPNPSKENWDKKGRKIYRKSRDQVYKQYKKVCAYSAEWIPSKNKTIDHFIPISTDKTKAFEWDNFRLCSEILNQNKGSEEILDPFDIEDDWFVMDFELNLVKPNSNLSEPLKKDIRNTIKILKLNKFILKDKRMQWIDAYYKGSTGINGLEKKAPFIAYELKRQNYLDKIKDVYERYLKMTK